MKTHLAALHSGTAPVALALALATTPALAQTAPAADDAAGNPVIVVTGSLIKNPNLVQASPINVTTADTIELKQSNVAEEVLREIPGVVPNIGSAVNNGNGGSSYVDLRGLGSNRNVVLLDGNRIVPADLQGRVDLNNIPLALVSHVDAMTGAAVTTYGADAITGVVNFVTKKDFTGVDLAVSQQMTAKSDGKFFRADLTVGSNFADDRGNAVLAIGYQKSDPVYQGDRDFSIDQISSYSGGAGGSGTSVPARVSGTRPLGADGSPNLALGTANGGTRQINAAGAAVATFKTFNFNPYNIFQTPFQRYNIFAQANYKVSDSVEVYTRGMFSKNTVSTIIAPSGSFGGSVNINLNNPYLPATLRNQFCAFDVNPRADIYTPRFTPAECDAAAAATSSSSAAYRVLGTGGFVPFDINNDGKIDTDPKTGVATEGYNPNPAVAYSRRAVEVGPRISDYSTTVFDYRVGLRGELSGSINWDLNAAYGESEKIQTIRNYTLQSRWREAALANNTSTCISGNTACVPVNLFGPAGSITVAQAAFLTADSTTKIKTTLGQVRGVINGDLPITSPGAGTPMGFAGGAEYRSYKAQQASDLLAKTPGELGGAGGAAPDINGAYKVYEAYAELIAPLVEDKPLFKSLTLEGGGRYSKYTIQGGGKNETWTYKAALSWEPVNDIKLRTNYARAVRAPNINELFRPLNVGLTNLSLDPCAGSAPTGNANLRAVCLAQGAPAGTIGAITNPTAAQANVNQGGNLTLKPETATTWTAGIVLQPSFAPRLSISVDYYNIKVKDVIGAPTPGDLINDCFANLSAASATKTACTVIRRNPITGGLDGDPATTDGLYAPDSNLGRLRTDGVDVAINYSRDFGKVQWQVSVIGNYTAHLKYKATPTSLNRECAGYYSINCGYSGSITPKVSWSVRNTATLGKFDVSMLWRHIAAVNFEAQQLADDLAAAKANPDCPDPEGADAGGCMVEPAFRKIKAYDWFDLTLRFNVTDNFSLTGTVQNMFDRSPPIVGNTLGNTAFNSGNTYPSTYDALGRRFAVSGRVKF